ncbi:MAG TPA: 23S rRNA (guanosine(2251)-2'-O)-methyltransferase RlmB [Thermodesulfobacteriota bacterium]|nr:23S rRNA (guanosine(2251)-2'-O)-methyltransferase RlmB [Thermodesulfobacteriota bacterium]
MIIYGRNPVKELLSQPDSGIEEILILKDGGKEGSSEIFNLAKERGIRVVFLPKDAISRISGTTSHQGVAARIADFEYSSLENILSLAENSGERPLIVLLDHIEDPQNLGAIIRTVDVLGAHGVVIPKDRAASVTPAVVKASAGAVNHVLIARVVNLSAIIGVLKKKGVWIVGADPQAPEPVYGEDLGKVDIGLVIGSEGRGLGQKIKEQCDFLVTIPQAGKVASLNASVSAGILIYEIMRQRGNLKSL